MNRSWFRALLSLLLLAVIASSLSTQPGLSRGVKYFDAGSEDYLIDADGGHLDEQEYPRSGDTGDTAGSGRPANEDGHPLTEDNPAATVDYGASRVFPLNIVFVGFDKQAVDTNTIDENIRKTYQFTYGAYDIGYGFDLSYLFADSSYYDALETVVLANSEADTTSALDATALEIQRHTGERMSIFTPQSGRAIDAIAVEEWLAGNHFRPDLEPAYWFYVINFTELEPAESGSKHWYTVVEMDFEADRVRDSWRLEWDNPLNPDVGFPYACFTSQSRVFLIDPSAHQ
ncbi:MAG: hypothetical protein ACNA7X_02805, partial [Dehalococcoidia bacterium]